MAKPRLTVCKRGHPFVGENVFVRANRVGRECRACQRLRGATYRPRADTAEQRFLAKVDKSGGPDACWPWMAGRIGQGYGSFRYPGGRLAHRYAYERVHGAIPAGLVIDHLCRNRQCVNPAHLEVVTQQINILRGTSRSAANALKTHCPSGHPYSGDNLVIPGRSLRSGKAERQCRECNRRNRNALYARQKAAA